MTKQLIFIFVVLCSLQAHASVQSAQGDTIQPPTFYNVTERLQSMQPVYLDGVVLPMSRTGNWFVSIAGGTTAFLGTPLGCEDLFGRLKPSYSLAVGNGSRHRSVRVSTTAVCSSRMVHCPNRTTTISMRICYGMYSVAGMPNKIKCAGILHLLPESDSCIMPRMGVIHWLSHTGCKDNTVFPDG